MGGVWGKLANWQTGKLANEERAGARRSREETLLEVGGGDHAGVALAEPAVAMAGEDVVGPVADGAGDEDQRVGEGPGEAEGTGDAEDGGGAGVGAAGFDQDHAVGEL